jgi:replicative DNA helicase
MTDGQRKHRKEICKEGLLRLPERELLRKVLIDNEIIHCEQLKNLQSKLDFDDERNWVIFTHMRSLAVRGRSIDLITLVESLNRHGDLEHVGGAQYLASLID